MVGESEAWVRGSSSIPVAERRSTLSVGTIECKTKCIHVREGVTSAQKAKGATDSHAPARGTGDDLAENTGMRSDPR